MTTDPTTIKSIKTLRIRLLQQLLIKPITMRVAGRSPAIGFILLFVAGLKANSCKCITAVFEQTHHDEGRRAKPRNGFYIIVCGRFESKLLQVYPSTLMQIKLMQIKKVSAAICTLDTFLVLCSNKHSYA